MTTRTRCRSRVSAYTHGNRSATSMTSQPTGGSIFGWRRFCPRISAFCRSAWAEERRRGEEYAGALEYLQRLDRHRHEFPFEALEKVAAAIGHWLDAGGGRQALGDLKELRQAAERVWEYQEFQPRRCDRREIHRKLQAMGQEAAA